jgi:hypothetical protein
MYLIEPYILKFDFWFRQFVESFQDLIKFVFLKQIPKIIFFISSPNFVIKGWSNQQKISSKLVFNLNLN